ncbi:MAG: hypothetical protein IPN87_13845 [Saprospiraceae bacterium]|nr:hypothetical protein [Candidatus Brachybacter algidus]
MEDNDNLEKYFRDKFNQDIKPDDWNIPDDDVWQHIDANIPKKERRRIWAFLPFILAGLAILSAVALGLDNYNKNNRINELQRELERCGNNDNEVDKSIGNRFSERSASGIMVSTERQERIENEFAVVNSSDKIQQNAAINTKSNTQNSINPLPKDVVNTASSRDPSSSERTPLNSENININPGERANQLPVLPSLNSYVISSIDPANNLITPENVLIVGQQESKDIFKKEASTRNKVWIGPVVGYNVWNDRISGEYIDPLTELLINEKTSNSLSFGLTFGKQISPKIVLNASVNYYSRKRNSTYDINLPYSTVDEISAGDDFENHFQHSLPTSLGNISTELILARSKNSSVQNNENVNLDLSLENIMKVISIPLTAQFFVKEAGNGLYFQTGILNEFILKNEIADISTLSHHSFVHDKSISISYQPNQVNKFNMRLLAGLGYQQELTRSISLALFANYGYALTNTFKRNTYQHKIDQIGMGIGLYKTL